MLHDTFLRRFEELREKSDSLNFHETAGGIYPGFVSYYADPWEGWATSAQNLIKAVFGGDSPHYDNFTKQMDVCFTRVKKKNIDTLKEIYKSAKEDFERGCVFNVDLQVSGEVFGDFIVLAKESLSSGHKDVAAVLAAAALEDSLKRYAKVKGINNIDNQSMSEVINALKSKRLVSGAQKSLLDAMPKIRNSAMHARWEKISEPEVNSMIGFVEQFLLTNFNKNYTVEGLACPARAGLRGTPERL